MSRSSALLAALAIALGAAAIPAASAQTTAPTCAAVVVEPAPSPAPSPAPADPACWVEVTPYPFGSDGNPVDLKDPRCAPVLGEARSACYLAVTSLAFRAWNRGIAATAGGSGNPFGAWLFNGVRWYPDPTFPGTRACPGSHVLWAGKLDYWLIGAGAQNWPVLCRFDGSGFVWQPLPVPAATRDRARDASGNVRPGGITTGACAAWNDCWFFGTYGAVVRWNGKTLTDASAPASDPWRWSEYNDAVYRTGPGGGTFGVAVGSTSGRALSDGPLPPAPGGLAPPQLYSSSGADWSPSAYAPPTIPQPTDPYRTDLVAVDFDETGYGWAAGVPAGWRPGLGRFDIAPSRPLAAVPEPAPIIALTPLGANPGCSGPASSSLEYARFGIQDPTKHSVLWSSLTVLPGSSGALVGGQIRPRLDATPTRNNDRAPEPVLARVACDGTISLTRFRIPDPVEPTQPGPPVAANRNGSVLAVAATAPNDAWVATSAGELKRPVEETTLFYQPPRLYRFSDGLPPRAPAGDDDEKRPLELQEDQPIIVYAPLPPPPPPPPPVVTTTTETSTVTLPPAVYAIKARVKKLTLYVSFKVRREVRLGLAAVRGRKVVASTRLRTFKPGRGVLSLTLRRKRWPTGIRFLTDAPTATLANPGTVLTGAVTLSATASATRGRTVVSVRFEYAPAGTAEWVVIGSATTRPFAVAFDTTKAPDGLYDLRAVVTDSAKASTASAVVRNRRVQNGASTP